MSSPDALDGVADGGRTVFSVRFLRSIIVLLVVAGCAVVAASFYLRLHYTETSTTTVTAAKQPLRETSVKTPLSDTLLVALLSVGAVLILSGAFYPRISKVTLPGGGAIEFSEYQLEAAKAVGRALERRGERGEVEDTTAKVVQAIQLAATRAAEGAAAGARDSGAAHASRGHALSLPAGQPVTRESWDKLAEAAIEEILGPAVE